MPAIAKPATSIRQSAEADFMRKNFEVPIIGSIIGFRMSVARLARRRTTCLTGGEPAEYALIEACASSGGRWRSTAGGRACLGGYHAARRGVTGRLPGRPGTAAVAFWSIHRVARQPRTGP